MDGQVARREDEELAKLLDQFVCVRIVQGYGLDLNLFQFDYDATWSVFLMNADKTIYGRYGTRGQKDAAAYVSLDGLKKTLQSGIELHKNYPAIKAALAGKTGAAVPWATPEVMPSFNGKYKKGDVSRQGCVHCHNIHEGEVKSLWKSGKAVPDKLLWTYPLPDVVGVALEPSEVATIKTIHAGSAAEKVGLKAGDRISAIDGQPIISLGDVQWVLHNAPETGALKFDIERAGNKQTVTVPLAEGWRRRADFTFRVSTWSFGLGIAGMRSEVASAAKRKELGLPAEGLALLIKTLTPGWLKDGNHASVKAGLKEGDVVVAIDGQRTAMNEAGFIAYLLQKKQPGGKLDLIIWRGGKELPVQLTLPR